MIEFKPHQSDLSEHPEITTRADANGWVKLPYDVIFSADDFEIVSIKINDTVYVKSTDTFWCAYNKEKTWDILASD